jgi:hypothetical protein
VPIRRTICALNSPPVTVFSMLGPEDHWNKRTGILSRPKGCRSGQRGEVRYDEVKERKGSDWSGHLHRALKAGFISLAYPMG